ncbi:MAG: flavodoxin family protein, partial [bacterium]
LADTEIRPCAGCHYCETKDACCVEDGMASLYPKLLEADVILLASPAYMGSIASRMQSFIERTWPLRKGQLAGKLASYIVTGRRRIGMATAVMEEYFTRLGVTKLPGVLGLAFEAGEVEQDREAVVQAERLAADCQQHLSFGIGAQREQGQPQAAGGMRRGTEIRAISSVRKE